MANLRRRLGTQAPLLLLLLLTLTIVLILNCPAVVASPTSVNQREKRQSATEEVTCGFDGDSDTYGLGIRIGLYFQWMTSAIAYGAVPKEAVTMRGINNAFQAAMFAGLLFLTITKGESLYAVEAYLMLLFCMGGICSGTATTPEDTKVPEDADGTLQVATGQPPEPPTNVRLFAFLEATTLGGYIRLLLGIFFNIYGLWFVYHGMDHMNSSPCSKYAFFFARVDLYGWFRTFLKVIFTLAAIPAAYALVMGTWAMYDASAGFLGGGWMKLGSDEDYHKPFNHTIRITRIKRVTVSRNPPIPPETPPPSTPPEPISDLDIPMGALALSEQFRRIAEAEREQKEREEAESEAREARLRENSVATQSSIPNTNAVSLGLPLFILMVELTIRWNKIGNVGDIGSTGQLLPLIIGVAGLWRVVYALVMETLTKMAVKRRAIRDLVQEDYCASS